MISAGSIILSVLAIVFENWKWASWITIVALLFNIGTTMLLVRENSVSEQELKIKKLEAELEKLKKK